MPPGHWASGRGPPVTSASGGHPLLFRRAVVGAAGAVHRVAAAEAARQARAVRFTVVGVLALLSSLGLGACDDDDPDLSLGTTYAVSFDLEATNEPLGALQFDVEYRGSGRAGWLGAGGGAACRWIIPAAIHACNNKGNGNMTCAVVDTGGFTGPTRLLECAFRAADDALTVDDFDVDVTDASTPNLVAIEAAVRVSSVVARPGSTATTTTANDTSNEDDVVFPVPIALTPAAPRATGAAAGSAERSNLRRRDRYGVRSC